jgi:hypothetical protein
VQAGEGSEGEAMTDDEALKLFLLEQFGRDEQTARAMSHPIEGLLSRWSPSKLIADCRAKRQVIEFMPACSECGRGRRCVLHDASAGEPSWRFLRPEDRRTARLLALPYAHLHGYREEWAL